MAVVYRSESSRSRGTSAESFVVGLQSQEQRPCVCLLRDVQEVGLSQPVCLLESDQWDAVLCALVIDLDFDGQKEVLLGTYGQVSILFIYLFNILLLSLVLQQTCRSEAFIGEGLEAYCYSEGI